MNKKVNKNFTEISRNSRVKMHKSGKHWVRTIMTSLGLFKVAGGTATETVKVDGAMVAPKSNQVVRGLVAAGALLGAQVSAEQVLAEETTGVEKTVSVTALSETVELSGTDTTVASQSESTTVIESDTTSDSLSTSESVSISESASESVSVSESTSVSESASTSVSTLLSEAASEAARVATSESAAVETPAEETATPAKVLEQVTSEAELLVDLGQKELTKEEDAALSTAVAASKTEIAAAKVVLADKTASLEQVEAQITAVKAASEALAAELVKRDEDGNLTAMLADINASKVNDGSGTFNPGGVALIEPDPNMQDPHKAEAQSAKQGTMVATTTAGYLTFKYYPFSA
ncbi:KxYKxGKxW signal peptide domain-containing protein [Streptococcus suis]|nr:KxYKxGKxW signal peptide domain-containing protein [Streptococcus suis]